MISALAFNTLEDCQRAITQINSNVRMLFLGAGYKLTPEGDVVGKDEGGIDQFNAQTTNTWDEPHQFQDIYWIADPYDRYSLFYEPLMAGVPAYQLINIQLPSEDDDGSILSPGNATPRTRG